MLLKEANIEHLEEAPAAAEAPAPKTCPASSDLLTSYGLLNG